MGSLRNLVSNPSVKKNQVKKPKRSWRGVLGGILRRKLSSLYPKTKFTVYQGKKISGQSCVFITWSGCNYHQEFIVNSVKNISMKFSSGKSIYRPRGLNFSFRLNSAGSSASITEVE
jgi:hypothetical protein